MTTCAHEAVTHIVLHRLLSHARASSHSDASKTRSNAVIENFSEYGIPVYAKVVAEYRGLPDDGSDTLFRHTTIIDAFLCFR